MDAQIADIAATATRVLFDPALLSITAVTALVFASGVAGHLAELVEHRTGSGEQQPRAGD